MTTIITRALALIAIIVAINATMFVVTAADASPVPAGAVVWEDGSWSTLSGDTGCIAGELCDDTVARSQAVWTACVTHALTTEGMGTDADMQDCDREYAATSGDSSAIWLYCPSVPEAGGCEARTD